MEKKASKSSTSSAPQRSQDEKYSEYLRAMVKQARNQIKQDSGEILSPRERHRNKETIKQPYNEGDTMQKTTRVSIIASMVPDEIINEHSDHSVRRYETALMFIDVSGECTFNLLFHVFQAGSIYSRPAFVK
ncbi:uncharacterized protein [Choristoneura fumiferana]|uniref:uncharacterized protein n=1 Tax=Choristoneura fumiferana TaxID=7141 RepID=UPI003D157CEB